MVRLENPWTLAIDGAEPVPCEFEARYESGLKYMRFVARTALVMRVGDRVPIVLAGGETTASGEGFVLSVSVSDYADDPQTVICSVGPLVTMPAEAANHG